MADGESVRGMARDPIQDVTAALDALRAAEADVARLRQRFHDAIRAAHRAGASYSAIGRALGISRQRVAEIANTDADSRG